MFLLDGMTRDRQTGLVEDKRLKTVDVPWGKVNEMKRTGPDRSAAFRRLVGNREPPQLQGLIESMGRQPQKEFMADLAQEYREQEVQRERADSNASLDRQPEREDYQPERESSASKESDLGDKDYLNVSI